MSNDKPSIVFATNNLHKLSEMQAILGDSIRVVSLSEIGLEGDIPEDGDTLEANALQKAQWVSDRCGLPTVADDTGLEVDALGGAPGVYSARYAGPGHDAAANTALLLRNLAGVPDEKRTARFRTVMAYIPSRGADPELFEGVVEGHITKAPGGNGGFGYDPVFRPEGWDITFAEAPAEAKNAVSHRGRAAAKFAAHILKK